MPFLDKNFLFKFSAPSMSLKTFVHFILQSFAGIDKSTGIRLLNVDIPPHAIRGQDARMTCKYDLQGDKLYSIKWYRNGHEFYRYIPSDSPQTTIFNGDGINVDVSRV